MPETADFVIAIPARYASVRLPGKPLRLLAGEPLIRHVVRRALEAGATQVVVATDDQRVADAVQGMGARACMTATDLASGSDRIAECARQEGWVDDTIVVNLQGDEPFAPSSCIAAVVQALLAASAPMATLATALESIDDALDPNCVKLVRNLKGRALYFSRAPVPWARDAWRTSVAALPLESPYLRHIGLYAYRAGFLREFNRLSPTPLEQVESLEQLRALEHGFEIAVGMAPEPFPAGIDTEQDLARAEIAMRGGVGS